MATLRLTRPLLRVPASPSGLRQASQGAEKKEVAFTKPGVQGSAHLNPWKGDIVAKFPVKVSLEAGKTYFWCACGNSRNQESDRFEPFCDGSHKRAGGPVVRPVPYVPAKAEEVFLCMCKQTDRKPFCDGNHKKLPPGPINRRINDLEGYHLWEVDKTGSVAEKLGFKQEGGVIFHKYNR